MSWPTMVRARRGMSDVQQEVLRVAPGAAVVDLARRHADGHVSVRALELEALLHLPRLADAAGVVKATVAEHEVARLSRCLHVLHKPAQRLLRPPAVVPEVSELAFGEVEESLATTVMKRLHYLHSPRRESVHLGSFTSEGRLAALVCVSPLDLGTIVAGLPPYVAADETLVVSRVFALDWAPRNAISRLLASVERRLREVRPEVRLLLTYLNPNLGFDGASYRAANWMLFGYEAGTRYGYLDADYITDREIARLPAPDRCRVVYSLMPLAPLMLFGRLLRRRDRRRLFAVRIFPRP
jgi:hypothetical protein